MEPEGEWSALVESLAEALVPALSVKLRRAHYERILFIRAPSEKLIYLYLVKTQPQTFVDIRRALGLGRMTVDRALKGLMEKGYVVQDIRYLYWIEDVE
jgi:predicted DNA-binding transcriptional regulator